MTLMADVNHSWLDTISSAGALVGFAATRRPSTALTVSPLCPHGRQDPRRVGGNDCGPRPPDGRRRPELLRKSEAAAFEVEGIEHVHVRTRWSGHSLLFDVEGFIPSTSTLDCVEALGGGVERSVASAVPERRDVLWSPHILPLRSNDSVQESQHAGTTGFV
jgi:divalent metal cation (Fe/Co/Zn/Cd) transporter